MILVQTPTLPLLLATPLTGAGVAMRLLAVLVLIGINAFFVAAEFSIVSVRRSRINQLAEGGDIQAQDGAKRFQRSFDQPALHDSNWYHPLQLWPWAGLARSTIAEVLLQQSGAPPVV
jgi:hypothetical protein